MRVRPHGRRVAFEVELNAALERKAVVVEGKEDDLVQLLPGTSVVNVHSKAPGLTFGVPADNANGSKPPFAPAFQAIRQAAFKR